jgi:hypothetical protein
MKMSVGVLDHYNVSTRKLKETVQFYEDVLGIVNGPRPQFNFPGYRRRISLADPQIDKNMTRATADLPGLEIEIIHQRTFDNVEQISIKLQAVPSFDAFGQFLETANPFAFWFRAVEIAWLPWSGLPQMMMQPLTVASTPSKPSSSGSNNKPSGQDDA